MPIHGLIVLRPRGPLLIVQVWRNQTSPSSSRSHRLLYGAALAYIAVSAYALLAVFPSRMRYLIVDLATTVSFILAPVVGSVNMRLVTRAAFPRKPSLALRLLAIAGIIFLVCFCGVYFGTLLLV